MDKMRMESVDMTAQNIEKIGVLFPNCITEAKDENGKLKKAINFELLNKCCLRMSLTTKKPMNLPGLAKRLLSLRRINQFVKRSGLV